MAAAGAWLVLFRRTWLLGGEACGVDGVAIGVLDAIITGVLTAVALTTHTLLLLLPAAGWAYLTLRQLRLARRAAAPPDEHF